MSQGNKMKIITILNLSILTALLISLLGCAPAIKYPIPDNPSKHATKTALAYAR